MAINSSIEWTDATWNPTVGCSLVSPGCTNCYAMRMAHRVATTVPHYKGLTKRSNAGPVWTGKVALSPEKILTQPLRWRTPRRIFVNSMSDLFHDAVPDAWIDQVFAVMAMATRHTFQLLTKRPERMRAYFAARTAGDPWAEAADAIAEIAGMEDHPVVLEPRDGPLPNVHLGVSAERQWEADERIPQLLQTPAAKRFVSLEPLLGPIMLHYLRAEGGPVVDALAGEHWYQGAGSINSKTVAGKPRLDWVIAGGESGAGARPPHPRWFRDLRDACARAGVPFFFKQWGAWAPIEPQPEGHFGGGLCQGTIRIVQSGGGASDCFEPGDAVMRRVGKKEAGALLDGREHREMPE
ncbi:MAG: phage Gp37/Gp68 family protein [Alphaproteobacteria bacterium]|nr:phage Gp37/Gp68 family protein [Alphaproteobacteria bacterium]